LLGLAVIIGYVVLRVGLSSLRKKQVEFLNSHFDAVVNSKTHEELRDNLEVLLRKFEEIGWTEGKLGTVAHTEKTSVYDRYQDLRKCLELTVTAIDYKVSRRADPQTLRKLKVDLPNLEIQVRSIGWREGETSVAQRLYDDRYRYWFSFAAALRVWSCVALPMIVVTWLFQATSVVQGQRDPKEVFTLGYYSVACLVSYVFARWIGCV
jgi:hypothetical protein